MLLLLQQQQPPHQTVLTTRKGIPESLENTQTLPLPSLPLFRSFPSLPFYSTPNKKERRRAGSENYWSHNIGFGRQLCLCWEAAKSAKNLLCPIRKRVEMAAALDERSKNETPKRSCLGMMEDDDDDEDETLLVVLLDDRNMERITTLICLSHLPFFIFPL